MNKGLGTLSRRKRWVGLALILLTLPFGSRAESKPLTVEMWGLVESRLFIGTFKAIREYERLNPGIRIAVGTPGGQGELDSQKLMTAVAARTPPDVVWFGRHNMGVWAPRGAFRPLDDWIKRDGIDLNEYYPGTIRESQWEGKTYALPWNVDCRVLFSNMKVLREHGFDRPPSTWDEIKEYTRTLTRYDESRGRYELLGFAPNYGNAWLYLYGWQMGARWVTDDGRYSLVNSEPVVKALQWMVEMTDLVGGAERVAAFSNSAQMEGIGDPFLSDRLAMQINGSYTLDFIARLKPDMDFAVSPPPIPEVSVASAPSWSGGFSWVIPADARHPEEGWAFARWMNSEEAWIIQSDAQARYGKEETGESALFVPIYHANRVINERIVERYSEGLPEKFRQANQVCLDLLPHSAYRPVSPAASELWDAQATAALDATFHIYDAPKALDIQQRRVQGALDRFYEPPRKVVPIRRIAGGVMAVVMSIAVVGAAFFCMGLRGRSRYQRRTALSGVFYVSPWLIGFMVLVIGPMLFSLVMSFMRYDVFHEPQWIGLGNWARMFGSEHTETGTVMKDPLFWKSLWNTLFIVLFGVPVGMVVSLAIAMLLNQPLRFVGIYRTLYYVPVIVPAVASAFIFIWLLNPETGFLNGAINPIFRCFGKTAPAWFTDAKWAKPGLILLLTWGCGGTVIIWLAGLQTIPRHLYEAATIDGAGPWRKFTSVTLPLLTPYALFILIMGTIGSLQIFTQAYLISAPGDALLFFVLQLFFKAFRYFEMGYACAMAWVLFAITVVVCLWQLRVSRKYVHYEGE